MARLWSIVVASAVAVFAVSGCGVAEDTFAAEWSDASGETVEGETVNMFRGGSHCDWERVVFLELGWPLGRSLRPPHGAGRQYVRDPSGVLPYDILHGKLDLDARLPPSARDTGYRADELELWIGDDVDRYVYVVRRDTVERWPRTDGFGCA